MTVARLEAALAAARAGDHATARDAAIAAWRSRRSPVLAELVDVLDARAPDAVTAAIAAIVTPRAGASLANLRALEMLDDPRLARFAIDALVRLPFTTASAQAFLLELAAVAARHDDPRLAERAPAIRAALTTRIGRLPLRQALLDRVDRAIVDAPPVRAPTAAESALEHALSVLVEPLRTPARSAAALLAEIYARPADDAPRLVYADLLSAQRDPRGEFIVMQIERARRGVDEPSEREQELLKRHGRAWLGALAPVLSWGKGYARTRFRRGFVAHADIIVSVGRKLGPLMTDPAWATVESFETMASYDLLATAPLRALREVSVNAYILAKLAARVETLAGVARAHVVAPVAPAALRAAFPNLATLVLPLDARAPWDLETYAASGVPHIEVVHRHVAPAELPAVTRDFAALLDAWVGAPAVVDRLTLHPPFDRQPRPPPIELRADADGRLRVVQPDAQQ